MATTTSDVYSDPYDFEIGGSAKASVLELIKADMEMPGLNAG